MTALRYWFVVVLGWFFLFYNIERLSEPINIASFMYILIPVLAILVVLFPWLQRISLIRLFLISLLFFVGLKIGLGYQIDGKNLPVTVTEICSLGLTLFLSRQVGRYLEEFRKAVTEVMINHLKNSSQPFEFGQGAMYREVRRARTHQRPLALLAIAATKETVDFSINRFIKEVQRKTIKQYITARLAHFLTEELRDYDLIAQRNNHFITLLPGIGRQDIADIIQKLESAAKEKLGLTLRIGISTFPEEVTFERLVDQAEAGIWHPDLANSNQGEDKSVSIEATLKQSDVVIQ